MQNSELDIAAHFPKELAVHAHYVQLSLCQKPADRLRLEQRLGHPVGWYLNGPKIAQALDGLHALQFQSQTLRASLRKHLGPEMAASQVRWVGAWEVGNNDCWCLQSGVGAALRFCCA